MFSIIRQLEKGDSNDSFTVAIVVTMVCIFLFSLNLNND